MAKENHSKSQDRLVQFSRLRKKLNSRKRYVVNFRTAKRFALQKNQSEEIEEMSLGEEETEFNEEILDSKKIDIMTTENSDIA